MSTSPEYSELGMNRSIDRRDFLNGVAIGVTAGLSAFANAQAQGAAAENDPPLRTGLRGNYLAAIDEFCAIRQGKYAQPSLSDVPNSKTRIRLSSPVVRVKHEGPPGRPARVRIAYRNCGKTCGVRARYCILACNNALISSLMPEIPAHQKEALAYPVKVSMLYTNVLLKKWTAFQKLGVSRSSAPGMYHPNTFLDPSSTVGGYQGVTPTDEPIIFHMTASPNKPGLPRKDQNRHGQQELLSMTFEQFELKIRDQLARMAGPGGFDPAEDIAAITVNRWPYGYAYTYDTLADPDVPPEQRPHIIGRQRFGRVTIANSDAGAAAFTNQAIDEANRAVQELLLLQGLT